MTVRAGNTDKIGLKIPEHWNRHVASIEVKDEEYDVEVEVWYKVAHPWCVIKYKRLF
jgi:outer membrane phospholipase A